MCPQGILYVFEAGESVLSWLRMREFPFTIVHQQQLPRRLKLPAVCLLPIPAESQLPQHPFHRIPCVFYGDISNIEDAFGLGARDFIQYPFNQKEFTARISRLLFLQKTITFPLYSISLQGNVLQGPKGTIDLNDAEANIVRMLAVSENHRLNRTVLQQTLWPGLQVTSRMVDVTISRLRKKLAKISHEGKPLQIKAIQGFGYQI